VPLADLLLNPQPEQPCQDVYTQNPNVSQESLTRNLINKSSLQKLDDKMNKAILLLALLVLLAAALLLLISAVLSSCDAPSPFLIAALY